MNTNKYTSPAIELLSIEVEQGFATSLGGAKGEDMTIMRLYSDSSWDEESEDY